MTRGSAKRQTDLLDEAKGFCDQVLDEGSIYAFLHRERDQLFPDEMFEDLFAARGRRSIPPSVVAGVMVLQRLEGCSDREAVERLTFDLRWKYAVGLEQAAPGFAHTVLVNFRARLRSSADPDRIFRATTQLAASAGLVGTRRVLDSAPLYDAVATQDTVTLIRGGIRGLLRSCGEQMATQLRGLLGRDDDYAAPGKPVCDWEDADARAQLVDELVNDAMELLEALEGRELSPEICQATELLATVVGQDVDHDANGYFFIARRTAKDRVISTVDPEARHGHKTSARSFDGYKGHIAIDPDSEIITAAAAGPANGGDGTMLRELITDVIPVPADADTTDTHPIDEASVNEDGALTQARPVIYGDAAYGGGANLAFLEGAGAGVMTKVQRPQAPGGRFSKEHFAIDLAASTVTCPNGIQVSIGGASARSAKFGDSCRSCPLREQCTTAAGGRVVSIGPHEALLQQARTRQKDQEWKDDYRATRPKVERKLAHMLRRRHGGRHARVRGKERVDQDFKLLGAAINVARLAILLAPG